jgi:hypothetical protein
VIRLDSVENPESNEETTGSINIRITASEFETLGQAVAYYLHENHIVEDITGAQVRRLFGIDNFVYLMRNSRDDHACS